MANAPKYKHAQALQLLTHPTVPKPAQGQPRDCIESGWYSFEAVNKLLYYTTTTEVSLKVIATITPAISLDLARTQVSCQAYLMSRAPPRCQALYIHAPGHFKCWKQSPANGQWYELDSVTYATTQMIRQLSPRDWESLQDCTISTTVQADAYLHNTTGMPLCKHRRRDALARLCPSPPYLDLATIPIHQGPTDRPQPIGLL
jgi:hypothetical protein